MITLLDAIMAVMVIEAGVILLWRRDLGARFLPTLGAGFGLVAAMWLDLMHRPALALVAITGALAAHLTDLRLRWR